MAISYHGYDPQNQYDEWLYIDNAWELINDTIDDSDYQTTANLVTSVSSASTDSQYPSAKLFYDTVGDIESALNTINNG